MRLREKTVLITGASRGIGAAMAESCAREGANVILTARTADVVKTAERICAAGGAAEALPGDITDEGHLRKLVLHCRSKYRSLDVLINNAGIMIPGRIGMTKMEDVRNMFEVNVISALNLIQYASRLFSRTTGGSIVNVASIAGVNGVDGLAGYSSSKAALIGLTKAAAKELAGQNIRVNAIAPGYIDTDLTKQFSPQVRERTLAKIGLGRAGLPVDVAAVVVFLASDESAYVTGQVLGIDGGMET